jgi:very-short-patch-repair endonuclease
MSYSNQPDHSALDRLLIRDYLLNLLGASVATSPSAASRGEHLQLLTNLTQSDLEREWLKVIHDHNFRLPDTAQKLLPEIGSRPDFLFEDARVAVYVDGPHHKYPERQNRDHQFDDALILAGWTPLRFDVDDIEGWIEIIKRNPSTFGSGA